MEEREKIYLEDCGDYVLRFNDKVCLFNKLEAKFYRFLYLNSVNFANHFEESLNIENSARDRAINYNDWFYEGKECQLLRPSKEWKKGKIKLELRIEFCPDESEELSEENDDQEIDNITE